MIFIHQESGVILKFSSELIMNHGYEIWIQTPKGEWVSDSSEWDFWSYV